MSRGTKKIELPISKISVELYEYATGRDMCSISSLQGENDNALSKMIDLSVVSVDGSSENISERVLDLHAKDYVFIIKNVSDLFDLDEKKTEESSKSEK